MTMLMWSGVIASDKISVIKDDNDFFVRNEINNNQERVFLRERGTRESGPSFLRCCSSDCYDPHFCEHVEAAKRAIEDWVKEGKMEDPFQQPSENPKLNLVVETSPLQNKMDDFYKKLVEDLEEKSLFSNVLFTAAAAASEASLSMSGLNKAIQEINEAAERDKRKSEIVRDLDPGWKFMGLRGLVESVNPDSQTVTITINNNTDQTIEVGSVVFRDNDLSRLKAVSDRIVGVDPAAKEEPKEPPEPRNIFTEFEL